MIRLGTRPDIIPESLKSSKVEEIKKQIENKVKAGIPLESSDFRSDYWRNKGVKDSLKVLQHGKCCYCERMRDTYGEINVEHFRPKGGIKEEEGHPGYWWLAYKWENLLLACTSCNKIKSTQFPLLPGGERAFAKEDDLDREKPVLINPFNEDPEKFIGFDLDLNKYLDTDGAPMVKAVGLDREGRGSETVDKLTAINKTEVMLERAQNVKTLKTIVGMMNFIVDSYDNHDLKNEYRSEVVGEQTALNLSFVGLRRAFFRDAGLGEYVAKD
ncbi:MAG: hypothetical protein GTN76_05760 [Candidatus Aenigmarchaeota archaeon]|nr:hypothetical protein [Candidatus Aenigmarchaeota archaeon]